MKDRNKHNELLCIRSLEASRMVQCHNCEEQEPHAECTTWNRTRMRCKKCKTNYNRQCERNAVNAALKAWWNALSHEEKVNWYKKQKLNNPQRWQRKNFDQEFLKANDFDEKRQDTGDLDNYVPMSEFVKEAI